ncbi:GNAT family N-acetyltransferase [Aliiroseovarius subalbicans]|uniref:GNAT family N-acetyltransferase n=1 Tax=Aliiroseovarius subalbicans TaxID=2925840 RepID=UPI001F5AE034|nr:GNAT family N-acetyltransferase [Aliiroseovarius subalbicans]MCI2399901.1 GNAT family N-acetyltransferase [Aliiroseovarius subalbicans]
MKLTTHRTVITPARPADAAALSQFHTRNAAHLAAWEPARVDGYHDPDAWADRLAAEVREMEADRSLRCVVRLTQGSPIIANCNLNNKTRGAFQAAHLGYSIDAEHEGQGLMYEALETFLDHAFNDRTLNRVMANHRPENTRSAALLARLGFEREGFARNYLKISGHWRDHVLTSMLAEDWQARIR